jgi:prepilin-type N-terminal cleavage/methylation domain-containing protein
MTARMRPPQSRAGFTAIEALVALSLFGVGMLALLQLAPRANHTGMQGRRIAQATSLAQAKVEELRALPSNDDDMTAGAHVDADPPTGYARRWSVEDDTPITGMRRVVMTVSFQTSSADSVAVVTTYF